jgi:uncharacterized membrane protein
MSTLTATTLEARPSYRIDSIDLLRGFVMVIMALDHTRDFFHIQAWSDDPLNLQTTTPALYFTRWITHLCAPIFVFLAGMGGFFQSLRKTKTELCQFLIKRGLWLLIIEIIVMNFAFSFDFRYSIVALQTIWSIGISMIILGLMIWLPFPVILVTGLVIVLGHNALDYYEAGFKGQPGIGYSLLHQPGFYKLWDGHNLLILYPFLSWTGLMLLGYCFGKLYLRYEGAKRRKMLVLMGVGLLALFALLRIPNLYGDPQDWVEQKNGLYSFFSIMNVRKYPPSLLYMCATIGIGMLILAAMGNWKNRFTKFITVYGRVPFLYYILHFFLIHLVSAIFYLARGHSFAEGIKPKQGGFMPNFIDPTEGVSLFWVYVIWILIVVSLYPVCKWFSEYKKRHKHWWLSYL